ncbi:MAG: hypothetical protein L3J91_02940 [Thermoplasmata archaeon]|nr:hypothetical protein [Thermoplasmata archaeon]
MDRHAEGRILIMLASLAAAAILPVAGEVLWIGVIVNRRRVRPPPRPPPLPAST